MRIWIAPGPDHTSTNVQEFVVRRILAYHKVTIGVVVLVLVYVMNLRAIRQIASERTFCYEDVLVDHARR
jgi:hypothetical protein